MTVNSGAGLRDLFLTKCHMQPGQKLAVALLTEAWGSAPCKPGASLLIDSDGNFHGSVSGGCVEAALVTEALEMLEEDGPGRWLEFGISQDDALSAGLACGGRLRVWLQPLTGEAVACLRAGLEREDSRFRLLCLPPPEGEAGNAASEPPGGWFLNSEGALCPGQQLCSLDAGTMATLSREAQQKDRSLVLERAGRVWFLQNFMPPVRLVVLGAVHISQALWPMARQLGFDFRLIDPRTAWATPERFPGLAVETDWPDKVLPGIGIDERTAVICLTHDPRLDDRAFSIALHSPAFYIGALGSRKTHARRCERLREQGYSAAQISRIRGPVGMDIGGEGPAEIALSILADVVASLRGKAG